MRKTSVLIGVVVVFVLCFAGCLVGCSSAPRESSSLVNQNETQETKVEKYQLDITVSCIENLLFSRYDIDVYVDDNFLGTIDHGKEKNFQINLEEGKHSFRVERKGDSDVDGTEQFDMLPDESVLTCSVYCTSSQATIKDFSEKTKIQAEKDEADAKAAEEAKAKEEAALAEQREKERAETGAAEAARKEEEENAAAAKKAEEQQKVQEEQAARDAERAAKQAGPVSQSTAMEIVRKYGKAVYPYGFKLHSIMGVLNVERQPDDSLFLKVYCDVTNAYGSCAENLVCEAYVGGTEGSPIVTSFVVY